MNYYLSLEYHHFFYIELKKYIEEKLKNNYLCLLYISINVVFPLNYDKIILEQLRTAIYAQLGDLDFKNLH